MSTDTEPLVTLGVRCTLSLKAEIKRAAEKEQRTASNLAGLLLAWALQQLPRAGNALNLEKCGLQPVSTGVDSSIMAETKKFAEVAETVEKGLAVGGQTEKHERHHRIPKKKAG